MQAVMACSRTDTVTDLLERAQAGDRRAMDDLLAHITPFVVRICVPIARGHSADAVQETLLAVYRGIPGLRQAVAFHGWVRTIAVREATRVVRRQETAWAPMPSDLSHDGNPLVMVDVNDTLQRLSGDHREVLTLRLCGYSEDEMAAVLRLPVGTVRSRLHRARHRFAREWHPALRSPAGRDRR